ncbi:MULTISPECIES: ribose 5-phosphate isomerase B [unclassified Burkholderia]|uniref:ribose 5-phosphate isomerase B n=1 Tax=unclassified Burkholderia TaxID=2613784 RepID=UPI000753B6C4|nr:MULTISPECIES: ribose 5-phosphate isomerase B [unclassified Burkholderia]KVN06575.1 ribose-5-phosphate isomerase [Burkholderia sp. MSMB1552]KWZ50200.1 ribose-5-phosphate isomerase [Burkholderia sp. MSMB1588]
MKVAIGCDEAAYALKESIKRHLRAAHPEVELTDFGTHSADEAVLYPDIAIEVAQRVATGEFARAILLCGTGIGVAISANKVPGIRAAQCHDTYSAERARRSNDAQIITMGARVIGTELANSIVDAWLRAEFDGGRSQPKVQRIADYERRADLTQAGPNDAHCGS